MAKIINFIKKHKFKIVIFILIISFIFRLNYFDIMSDDYVSFLNKWLNYLKQHSFVNGLQTIYNETNCNYYLPYLILLKLGTLITSSNLIIIKTISIIFDYILAFVIFKFICYFKKDKDFAIIGALGYLFFPSAYINSAMWGQCDVIFATFILLSLYFLIVKKNTSYTLLFWTISFTFKIQAIFLGPILLILFLMGRMKIKDFIPTFLYILGLCLISTYIYNGNIMKPLMMSYFSQITENGTGDMFLPSIFSLFQYLKRILNFDTYTFNMITKILLIFTFIVVCILSFKISKLQDKISNYDNFLEISLIFALICPLMLPNMKERYYYLADALMIIYMFKNSKYLLGFIMLSIDTISLSLFDFSANSKTCQLLICHGNIYFLYMLFAIIIIGIILEVYYQLQLKICNDDILPKAISFKM